MKRGGLPFPWENLQRQYGPFPQEDHLLAVDRAFAQHMAVAALRRAGEVVLVLRRPDGHLLLHTKPFYPPHTWRLPSGGIHQGESPSAAVVREIAEETGLPARLERLLGVLTYVLESATIQVPFASAIFLAATPGGQPSAQDPKEQISGYCWVPVGELDRVAAQLRRLAPPWRSWGEFRALAHVFTAAHMAETNR